MRELELRTILDERPARTAWEAACSAARSAARLPPTPCSGAAAMFNDVIYGDRPADAEAYRLMTGFDDAVIRGRRSGPTDREPAVAP